MVSGSANCAGWGSAKIRGAGPTRVRDTLGTTTLKKSATSITDVSAAIGLAQLGKLHRTNARRREIVRSYNEALAGLDWLERPVERPYVKSAMHNYVVKLDGRDRLMAHLKERGISTGMHYIPNHLYDMYELTQ